MRCEANRRIHVEFGEVETGVTAVKWLEIINESRVEQIYEARRDATTNPLDHVYELCSYSWSLLPGQTYKCKIYYRPFVPFAENVDYFTIVDSAGERAEIQVRGTCIGPLVFSSATRLVMICTSENREAKKRIKLVNNSIATATFTFDIDPLQRPFEANPRHGYIGPRSRKCITITFAPREDGIYACHLPCLILNHKPIIIELYGYCCTALHKTVAQDRFNYPAKLKNGFEGYTSDTVVAAQHLPTVSSSKNCIDFGQADVETENVARKISETLCLTNHSQSDVLIKWNQEEIFNITPVVAKILANQTALFEIAFNPDRGSSFFARDLVGYVFIERQEDRSREEILVFPASISIRLIGHSFPVSSDGWIPQYEIPHVVKMPPCMPSSPIYTTFLIRKYGHLPLMFRFVPPASSHFIVKPMMGVIHQDCQIIVIGMLPGTDNERVYVERWAIRFNGNTKSECFIDFQGYTEYANVSFSDRNIMYFTPTFPGCQNQQQFYMRNITRHTIQYEFINVAPELRTQNRNGKICSNDTIIHEWLFCPSIIGDYEFNINCILIVLKDGITIGPSVCVTLHVTGRCESGFLMSAPNELNFGIQAYKDTKELSFHVFNLSSVNIYYKMMCSHCNWLIENIEHDVKIHPVADTVLAGQDKIITISITPTTMGCYEFFIQYFVRMSSDMDTLIPNQKPRNICKVCYSCILPTLKVTDLQYYGSYPNMSKVFLWKLMKINMLNMLLRDLQLGTSQTLYINFPAMILQKKPVIIKLLVINAAAVLASWNIRKIQLCSCRPVVKTQGLKFQRAKYDCMHRKVSSVQPKSGNLKPKEETWITLELRHILLGKTETKWNLDLGDNRHIYLIITIECLPDSDNKLHLLHGTDFKFQHVYFGEKNPIYQVCWVHNATNQSIPFSINPRTMREINQEYCYKMFSYATPYVIANPQTSVPILLKFQPRQFGIFKEKLRLTLGDEEKELTLEGESSLPHKSAIIREYVPCDRNDLDDDDNIPVYFSTDCINVSHMATHSHVVKMIIMHNNFMQDVLAYEWKKREISEIIHVEIFPQKGLIAPMSIKSFRVTIYAKGYPCIIDIDIPCEFINASQRRVYQRSVYIHEDLSQELEGQFIITEKDITVPELPVKILEKPQPFYKAITIRCSVYSVEDKFLKVSLKKELTSAPPKEICLEENEKMTIFEKEDISRSTFIIEGLLWEIVNSKLFKDLMQDILRKESNLLYPQFRMSLRERKRLIRRSYISPPRALINRIFEEMLFVIMHEEFALKTAHLVQHTDVRHTDYLNMVPSVNRKKTIRRETLLLHQEKYPSMVSELVPSSRISFAV